MNEARYFDNENYTGNHLHVDNYTDQTTPYIEAIAWERNDLSMDVFFTDFEDDKEVKELFGEGEHYYDEFKGVYLGNVKTDQQAYQVFRMWVNTSLYPYRKETKNNQK